MELRQLQYFVVVAEELHFGRTAERLGVVQPAASQQIRRLEAELGMSVLERSTRRVALTPAGQRLLPGARAVLAAAERLGDLAVALRTEGSVTLRLGSSSGSSTRVPALLDELARLDPDLDVDLVRLPPEARLAAVADHSLDAALVRGDAPFPGVHLHPVWHDGLCAAIPADHPLAGRDVVDLAGLQPLPLRLPARDDNAPLVDLVLGACRAAGFEPDLVPAADGEDILTSIGAGRPPAWTVYYTAQADELAAALPRVAFRPLRGSPLAMPTALALRVGDPSPVHRTLLAACRAVSQLPG